MFLTLCYRPKHHPSYDGMQQHFKNRNPALGVGGGEREREREKEGGGSNVLRKNVRYDQRSIVADGPIIRPKSPESQSTEVFFTAALTVCQKAPCVAEI